jgi:CCR4-NOT transcriptional complex subunit CAF120
MNPHQVARQSVWSTVLDPNPPPRNTTGKDTFLQVEDSETMTKAFQPQGLLSAGLQDKEDRSAKRQEELARETGASLINVPNKPPPPQTGLLGAITAHERERKREGGVGATLTEKERERRLAEERQRKLDELQRQQLDQMSQGGAQGAYDAYGQQQFPGFVPGFDARMSMNPMMLNPYMAPGYPMMPFGNTQQMMAAQMAAQQAYQQAMMSFSQAGGSQMGDNMSRVGVPTHAAPSPQMGPPSPMQGGMMGMDPRMSMGMNPWMGGGMGMGMNPMGGGMGMAPMGMMDPRMSMGQQNYLQRPESGQGHVSPFQGSPFQGTPSLRQGSPALRSNNNSPRPQPPT